MGNTVCRPVESNNIMTNEQFNRRWENIQPNTRLFGSQQADTSLAFAPFIDDGVGYNLDTNIGYPQHIRQCIHKPIHKLEEERNNLIQEFTNLMNKPIIETKVENSNPALEEYTNTIKNLKGYLLEINERYDSVEKRYLEKPTEELKQEFEAVKAEYSSIIVKLKSFNVLAPRTCVICFESEIEYFLDPCGHTICGGCKDKCQSTTKCHVCRAHRTRYRKLYL